jgi:hypothetical protein
MMVFSQSEVPPGARLTVADSVVSRPVDGSTVLLDVGTGRTFSLDDVGTHVWAALAETSTITGAVARLREEFEAPPGLIERDVAELVRTLIDRGLVSVRT